MPRILKILLGAAAALLVLFIAAAIVVAVIFDPNDYKDEIIAEVEAATGRNLEIEGDIELKLFPVLAIDIGVVRLGNAPGFDEEQYFATLNGARGSIRILPALFSRDIQLGSVEVDSLKLNLAVNERGVTNWADLAQADVQPDASESAGSANLSNFALAGLEIVDSSIRFRDAASGASYTLSNVNLRSGRVAAGSPLDLDGKLEFAAAPAGIDGALSLDVTAVFDEGIVALDRLRLESSIGGVADVPVEVELSADRITVDLEKQMATPGTVKLSVMNVDVSADVKPVDYSQSLTPQAKISVAPFSARTLMQRLGLEALPTADPDVLEAISLEALAYSGEKEYGLNDLVVVIDDTTFRGRIAVPAAGGKYRIALTGDSIDLTRYMAPTDEDASADDSEAAAPVEIPVDLIRAMDIDGTFRLDEALLGDMRFTNLNLTAQSSGGNLRLHPISADFFEGSYSGDVRIDASAPTTRLSLNETISGVNLAPLAAALFEQDNITGLINANFALGGSGADLDAIRRDLDGNLSITLSDGAYEGTDVWHQLRTARARLKGEAPPEPELPLRTRFSEVKATGTVTDGILKNDDFRAELPFLRLTGRGSVNLIEATVDYGLTARVLERPEFVTDATDEELAEFTEAVIPLKVTGPLAAPQIRPDIGSMLKKRVEEEAKERILDKLIGGEDEAAEDGEQDAEKDVEDALKDKLKDLFKK